MIRNILIVVLSIGVFGILVYFLMPGDSPRPPKPPDVVDVPDKQPVDTPTPSTPSDNNPRGISQMTRIVFYEGNGCDQDVVHSIGGKSWKGRPRVNDEARSAKLTHVPAGTIIEVYDSPNADPDDDDYAIARVSRFITDYCIHSFERDITSSMIDLAYYEDNGLDGKISYISVKFP